MGSEGNDRLVLGRAALASCDWTSARAHFEHAVANDPSPEALDGLGQARYWLGDYAEALDLRERAFAAHRRAGSHTEAASIAIQLAMLHGLIYGNAAAVSGWVAHAERCLDIAGDCVERGWLTLLFACLTDDPDDRYHRAARAVDTARRFGDSALEFDGTAYIGQALVERGDVDAGMRMIDAAVAAVTSGIVDDPWAAGEIYCTLFHACELALDVRRADAWLGAVDRYVERTRELPISAICRAHYGRLLTTAGRWRDAERELDTSMTIYARTYAGTQFEARLRLADLRARQGRSEEARLLIAGHEDHPLATEPRTRLHLARGEPQVAIDLIGRHLAHRGRGIASAGLLALLVDAAADAADLELVARCTAELQRLADVSGQPALRGLAALARARDERAADTADALASAIRAFGEAGMPYELARARRALAQRLADDQPARARAEAELAVAAFDAIGATADADEAAALVRRLGGRPHRRSGGNQTLTAREAQVLDLLAEGQTNADIASALFISRRTVEHHVSNILMKLGVANRTEAVSLRLNTHRVER